MQWETSLCCTYLLNSSLQLEAVSTTTYWQGNNSTTTTPSHPSEGFDLLTGMPQETSLMQERDWWIKTLIV